jgi:hypothetical protein
MSDEFPSWAGERPNWVRVWIGLLGLWATFIVLGTCFNYQSLLARSRPISWTKAIRMVGYGIWAFLFTPLSVGLQNGTSSQDYIQLWHGDANLLRESLEAVQQTAAVILGGIAP